MRVPAVLLSLTDQGVIDDVLRPLKSGKEAQVYLVRMGGQTRIAKVYKDAEQRSFKQRALYTEGRKVRNSRDQRAMQRRTRHGRAREEGAWKTQEMDVIYRLHAHGVRVPTPHNFIDGVLIMDLVRDARGEPAPRLAEVPFRHDEAKAIYDQLLREVIKMLCAGIVHGDLSDYNVLVDEQGPVVIDFPQAVDAAQNRNARKLLIRDVDNLGAFLRRLVPGVRLKPYGQEIWAAYEGGTLSPDYALTGTFKRSTRSVSMSSLMEEIQEAERDAQRDAARKREREGKPAGRPRKRTVVMTPSSDERGGPRRRRGGSSAGATNGRGGRPPGKPRDGQGQEARAEGDAPKRRRRRRRGNRPEGAEGNASQAPRDARPKNDVDSPTGERPDDAPRRRRRRRRRKGPAEGGERANDAAAKGNRSGDRPREGTPDRAAPRSGSPSRDGERQNARRDVQDGGGPRPAGEGDAPQKRRRRRRRRKPGGPPKSDT
ncbi:MAG: PA4780 family RIO1-like protein kinase [Sandaracinaceae bacterium]